MIRTLTATVITLLIGAQPVLAAPKFNAEGMQELQSRGLELARKAHTLKQLMTAQKRCLAVVGTTSDPGQLLKPVACSDHINQKWQLDAKKRLVNAGGLCVEYAGKVTQPGLALKTAECSDHGNQKWQFDPAKRLVNVGKLCLDASGKRATAKACSDAPLQKWTFK